MGQAAQYEDLVSWGHFLSCPTPPSFLLPFSFQVLALGQCMGHMVHEQAAGYYPGLAGNQEAQGWGTVHSGILEPPCVCSTVKGGAWQRSPVSGAQAFCYSIRAR